MIWTERRLTRTDVSIARNRSTRSGVVVMIALARKCRSAPSLSVVGDVLKKQHQGAARPGAFELSDMRVTARGSVAPEVLP